MAPNAKFKKACDAMKVYGINVTKVRSALKKLLQTYDNNWDFIEDEDYKVLLDVIIPDLEANKKEEKDEKKMSKAVTTSRGKRKVHEALVIYKEDDESEEDEVSLKKRLRRKPTKIHDNNSALHLLGRPISNTAVLKITQAYAEEEDESDEDEAPLERRSCRKPASSIFNSPMANNSDSNALMILNNDSFIDNHKPMIPENSSALVPEMEKSNILVKERNEETESVPSLAVKESSESGALMMLKCESFTNIKDITVGEENVKIPWVNEINEVVPSRFRYIPQSVLFKDASVKFFSISSFSDEQCCFSSCIGDCLGSPCNCTVAYTVEGVLKDDFLEERISEALDERKQVLRYCKECPLEKAKKEETLEPCKGHKKRKAIKECCIKCGCTKSCGNRVVQRGIRNKLEVFFMLNGKGWGLKTLEKLRKGAFVCEYIGEILTISELYERRSKDEVTSHVRLDANWGCSEECVEDNKALCIDGTRYGNISRFINHSCLDANLIEIPVHIETPDQHYYHLAFFATRDIEAMEELTWDYGVDFDDDECLIKPFDCLCGSRCCRNKRSKKAKKVMNGA